MAGERVSNEELLKDIENTRKEADAYEIIAKGYRILQALPENAGDRSFAFQAQKFENSHVQCLGFLQRIENLAKERGLIDVSKSG